MTTPPWTIKCPDCSAEYDLPPDFCQRLVGKGLLCDGCKKPWVPFPASGLLAKMGSAAPEIVPIELGPYRKSSGFSFEMETLAPPTARPPAPPASAPPADLRSTARVGPPLAAVAAPMLRVTCEGPDVDTRAVFDLGPRSFFIGKSGCHLNLPSSNLPARAIKIRSAKSGFAFEGIAGFQIPLGPVNIPSGSIDGTQPMTLALGPYRVTLEISATPGSPIADLEAPAAKPVSGAPSFAPPAPPAPGGGADLRAQLGAPPATRPGAPAPPAGSSETLRDMMAPGLAAQSFRDPLQGLQVGFVGTEGQYQGKAFRITKATIVVGRTQGDMIVPDSRVSSKHAQFDVLGFDQYSIKDLASTNGTTVNGRAVSTTMLKNGDVVGFGGVTFKFMVKSGK